MCGLRVQEMGAVRFLMKRSMTIVRTFRAGFVIAGFALSACAADTPTSINPRSSQPLKEIAPSELKIAPTKPGASDPKRKDSAQPAPAASGTPEEATKRAADPKDPSGALIIRAPAGTGAKP